MRGRPQAGFQEPTAPPSGSPAVGGGVRLIAGVERVGLCGRFPEVSRHQHAAPAVVVGVDGPLGFRADRTHDSRAVWIQPGFSHAVDTRGGRLAMFVLPPGADRGGAPLRDLADPGRWVALGEAVFRSELTDFAEIDHAVARARLPGSMLDDRLRRALDALTGTLDENTSIEEVASAARLSASRLMTLAHTQLGASLRSYRRWLRAFQVARAFAGGASLTDAALASGFASSAHLSTAARAHFGIRPSDILTARSRSIIRAL